MDSCGRGCLNFSVALFPLCLQILREYKNSSLSQLQKENALLLQEKEELTEKLLALRHDLIEDKENNSSKEIRILKKVVRHLEVCNVSTKGTSLTTLAYNPSIRGLP